MEVLILNFLSVALYAALVLSTLCVVLLMAITALHWHADRHQRHAIAFDRSNKPLLMSYLEGTAPRMAVMRSMEEKPSEALRLLMELSAELQPSAQSRLLNLFPGFVEADKEISALESTQTKRRLQAAERLRYLKDESSTEALLDALDDDVLTVRYSAARSLAAHGNTESIEPILLAFDAEHQINWFRLIEIITDYGSSAVPTLLAVLENPEGKYSTNILNVAIRSLGIFMEPQAVKPLIHLLDHPDISIRLNAAHALGDIGDPTALTPVAELSHDPNWEIRNNAVQAIGKLHAENQIPILEEALSDPSWWVRFTAAEALYSLGQPGIEKLKEIKKSTHNPYAYDMCRQVIGEHEILDQNNIPS